MRIGDYGWQCRRGRGARRTGGGGRRARGGRGARRTDAARGRAGGLMIGPEFRECRQHLLAEVVPAKDPFFGIKPNLCPGGLLDGLDDLAPPLGTGERDMDELPEEPIVDKQEGIEFAAAVL